MKTITDKTADTCRAALAQVIRDAEKHAATAETLGQDTEKWHKLVTDIKSADAELASA
ncbi:hypothetical protein K2Q02_03030 [Patescibacteria group bacterium]|nr:hypothetical protein [Patescibacteria group bacterium]